MFRSQSTQRLLDQVESLKRENNVFHRTLNEQGEIIRKLDEDTHNQIESLRHHNEILQQTVNDQGNLIRKVERENENLKQREQNVLAEACQVRTQYTQDFNTQQDLISRLSEKVDKAIEDARNDYERLDNKVNSNVEGAVERFTVLSREVSNLKGLKMADKIARVHERLGALEVSFRENEIDKNIQLRPGMCEQLDKRLITLESNLTTLVNDRRHLEPKTFTVPEDAVSIPVEGGNIRLTDSPIRKELATLSDDLEDVKKMLRDGEVFEEIDERISEVVKHFNREIDKRVGHLATSIAQVKEQVEEAPQKFTIGDPVRTPDGLGVVFDTYSKSRAANVILIGGKRKAFSFSHLEHVPLDKLKVLDS